MKILLIRIDRLGDLVCTLPVDQHPFLLDSKNQTHWLIHKGLEPVLDCAEPKRSFESLSSKFNWTIFFKLVRDLKEKSFDKVILFYGPWWVALACFIAKIPQRYSPQSRWFQLLFFNFNLKQKRSRSEKHESEYNWDLLKWALQKETTQINESNATEIQPCPILQLKSRTPELNSSYIVIHPGMGGSALNWPWTSYLELIQNLASLGKSIVITGTPADAPWLKDLELPAKSIKQVQWKVGEFDLKKLISVLAHAEAVVAPSTGVIHLAASTGVKTIGIYSPIRVQHPTRWAPRGSQVKALSPDVNCPASNHCLKEKCKEYLCLNLITPQQILNEILK